LTEYPTRTIEERWQRFWNEHRVYRTPEFPKRKYYVLEMYPYPSGDLHMGHARNYLIGDTVYRYRRMQGYDVLHPFGWDAFGLPAENAAIAHGNHPCEWTYDSINLYRQSFTRLGVSYDWDREVTTCEPGYYRWNQWLFIKLLERGLAYRKEAYVNWCTGCRTVLADEQVEESVCYRCRAPVEKRKLTQWFFRITAYAQRLLDGLDQLPRWPENVKTMQRNWIGRSEGCEVDFRLADTGEKFPIFTTRPDTLYGVTFMALAPDAPLAETITRGTSHETAVRDFIQRILQRPEIERIAQTGDKEGIFTGKYSINPLTGDRVPIYIADFVLASYGTGMIMAVPGHDQRDFEFARKYQIPIKVVIESPDRNLDPATMDAAYVDAGTMVNSGPFDGTPNLAGIDKVIDHLVEKGIGHRVVNYRLKDWLVSRQRYWGTPIPMIHCPGCGIVPVPEDQLPVMLPQDVRDFKPSGKSVLAGVDSFYHVACPKCTGPATRDPDTMDTFVDSSWYYIRYTDPHNLERPFEPAKANAWLPVDQYIGGIEHATGHLIFFRFVHKVLHDLGMLDSDEPCTTLHTHGMVTVGGETMSSSRGTGVWVGDFLKEHGADVARLAVLFAAPPDKGTEWQADSPVGVSRFIARIYRLYQENLKMIVESHKSQVTSSELSTCNFQLSTCQMTPAEQRLYIRLNQTIRKVTDDLEGFQFNTGIAALMEFLNDLVAFADRQSKVFGWALNRMMYLLAPFTPHLAEELWHQAGGQGTILDQRLPGHDPSAVKFDEIEIPIQVNGKLRSKLVVARGLPPAEIEKLTLADAKVQQFVHGQAVKKIIYIPDRLVNLVVIPRTEGMEPPMNADERRFDT
jgi:leucyl-tRNA synthetase